MEKTSRINYADFIAGGGETGQLIRSIDWSKTSIGPSADWPQSLRTSVTTALNTRFPILIWWGPDLTLIYNDAYIPIFAGKHPAAMGKPGLSRFGWGEVDVKEVIGPMLSGVMETGKATWSEDQLLILERNGYPEETYFTWSYSPIFLEDGKVGGVLTIVTETTQRVISQRRLNILRDLGEKTLEAKTLKEAIRNVEQVLEGHPLDLPFFLFYLVDDGYKTLYLAGKSSRDIDGKCCPEHLSIQQIEEDTWPAFDVFSSAKEAVVSDLGKTIGSLPSGSWPEEVNTAFVTPVVGAGQKIPYGMLIAGISPRLDFDKEYKSFLRLLTDQIATAISNVKTIEEERKRAEALAEIDKAKTIFFSNISHEFRTPLTLMLSPLQEVLDNAASLDERNRANLKTSLRNTIRLQKLVNTLLDFSKIEAGRFDMHYEEVDVCRLTADLASSFRSAIEEAGIKYSVDVSAKLPPLFIDVDVWEKIVLNLISNAFKYTERGKIAVSLAGLGDKLILRVEDSGVGISKEDQQNIFRRFYRVHNVHGRSQEGTGIGLSMVKELIQLLGGDIAVDSEVGRGSTFSVTIPMVKSDPRVSKRDDVKVDIHSKGRQSAFVNEAKSWTSDSKEKKPVRLPKHEQQKRPTVLIADDNRDMRDYISRLLENDFHLIAVTNGEDAYNAAVSNSPDLVVSDIMMPKVDGFALLKKLKSTFQTRNIPVIFLSARAGEEARVEGIQAGADDYLVKPFSAKELLARISNHIAISRIRRETEKQFFNLFLQSPAHIHVLRGPDHVVEFFHPLGKKFVGGKDFTGRKIREVMPELEGQGYFEMLDQVYHEGKSFFLPGSKAKLRSENGTLEEYYFNITYLPWRDADGHVIGVLQFAFDVTQQVKATLKISESEERFRVLANSISQIVWITDGSGQMEYLSDQWQKYTGQSPAEGVDHFIEFIHDADRSIVVQAWTDALSTGNAWKAEYRLKSLHGVYRWFFGQTMPLTDSNGKIIKWIGSATDIQNQKEINEQLEGVVAERTGELIKLNQLLQNNNAELAQARTFLQTVLDSSIELVTAFDTSLNYTFTNKRFRETINLSADQLIGRNVLEVKPGFEHYEGYQLLQLALAGETTHLENHRFFFNEKVVLDTFVTPLRRNEEIVGVLVMQRDITALNKLTADLQASNRDLVRSNEDLQQFAHVTSHDLREPVRKIQTYESLLRATAKDALPPKAQAYLEKIERAANRISTMIEGILRYSSVNAVQMSAETIELNRIVETIKEDLELLIEDKQAVVHAGPLPTIRGAETLIYQLFYNIINNSLKFAREGQPVKIEIRDHSSELAGDLARYVRIDVMDNGIGFDQVYAERIFDSFQRLHPKDKFEGTGLGLALCKKIAERHGGFIQAFGKPDEGATFSIFLPAIR